MLFKDKRKLVYYCSECNMLELKGEWVSVNKEIRKQIADERQNGFIKFVKTICPACLGKKQKKVKAV